MSSKIHIRHTDDRSLCHLRAKNVLVEFDKFIQLVDIVPKSLCPFCLMKLNKLLENPEEMEQFRREQGLNDLSRLNKT